MRLTKPTEIENISQVLTRHSCPICIVLKNEQSSLLQGSLPPESVRGICNFHAWALAAAVNFDSAARVFRNLLHHICEENVRLEECTFCARLDEEEVGQLKNLVQQMDRGLIFEWMRQHGTFCRPHLQQLRRCAPLRVQAAIDDIELRTAAELKTELEALARQAVGVKHAGGGILGRVAEFLTSQRGVGHYRRKRA